MLLKPANLRKVEFEPAAAADAALPLEDRLRLIISIMEGNTEQRQYNQGNRLNALLHAVREGEDGGGLSRLSNYLASIFACIRSWYELQADPAKLLVRGHPDGSQHILFGGKKCDGDSDAGIKIQARLLARVQRGIHVLGALLHFKQVRRKAQSSDVVEILAAVICSPCFQPYALETAMQCASSLLGVPASDKDARHAKVVSRFFKADTPGMASSTPFYDRLTVILNGVDEKTFSGDCVRRILRWSVTFQSGSSSLLDMIAESRTAIAQMGTQLGYEADEVGAQYCGAENCLNQEDTSGKPFNKCGGCRLAKYCCRQCQLYDWKHGGHKRECATANKKGGL